MCRENPSWGAPRIQSELALVRHTVSETTVNKYRTGHRRLPSQTWRTFLDNHLTNIVAIDFFTVLTGTFRILFAFVVLRHDRRKVVHFNITAHPTAEWTTQQITEAFPGDQAPRFLVRDRDSIYGEYFRKRVKHTWAWRKLSSRIVRPGTLRTWSDSSDRSVASASIRSSCSTSDT